jgi:hypothetical protein
MASAVAWSTTEGPAGSVDADYRHVTKVATPRERLTLGETCLKWYDVAPAAAPVPLAVRLLARRNLRDGFKEGTLPLTGDLGFVILHRCGDSFYFLLVSTWCNDNELWETVWAKVGERSVRFDPWPDKGTHRPTFCVWELGAVCHERKAWGRYLRTSRDEAARRAYLHESFEGEV